MAKAPHHLQQDSLESPTWEIPGQDPKLPVIPLPLTSDDDERGSEGDAPADIEADSPCTKMNHLQAAPGPDLP